ncbi:hypothetical protein HDK77DRAFT_136156 [Phyllosticta capitalensis]
MSCSLWDEEMLQDVAYFDQNQGEEIQAFEVEEDKPLRRERLYHWQVRNWVEKRSASENLRPCRTRRLCCLFIDRSQASKCKFSFPFDSETLKTILRNFRLPVAFLDAIHGMQFMTWVNPLMDDSKVVAGFSIASYFAAAWSHCAHSNTTYALVLTKKIPGEPENFTDLAILKSVEKSRKQKFHPLFIPTELHWREFKGIQRTCNRNIVKVINSEGSVGIDGEAETDEEFLKNFEKNLKAMEKLTWDLVIFESMGQLLSRGVKNLLKGMEKPQLPKESESRFLDFETKTSLDYLAGAMQ